MLLAGYGRWAQSQLRLDNLVTGVHMSNQYAAHCYEWEQFLFRNKNHQKDVSCVHYTLGVYLSTLTRVFVHVMLVLFMTANDTVSSFNWFHWAFDESVWKSVQTQVLKSLPSPWHRSPTLSPGEAFCYSFSIHSLFMSTSAFVSHPSPPLPPLHCDMGYSAWMLRATWNQTDFFASKGRPPHPKALSSEYWTQSDVDRGIFHFLIMCLFVHAVSVSANSLSSVMHGQDLTDYAPPSCSALI